MRPYLCSPLGVSGWCLALTFSCVVLNAARRLFAVRILVCSFVHKLISCGYGRQYIDMLLLHCNYVIPHNSSLRRPFTSTKPHVMWLVMPYHPVWERSGLKRVVAPFCDDTLFKDLLFEAFGSVSIPQIKVAWKISSVPFGGTLVKW